MIREMWQAQRAAIRCTDLEAITWSGTRFVAVGHGSIVYSDDGISWTKAIDAIESFNRLNAVLWTGTRFIAVGSEIVYSP